MDTCPPVLPGQSAMPELTSVGGDVCADCGLSIPSSVAHPKAWQWPQQRGQKPGVGTWEVQPHSAGASFALSWESNWLGAAEQGTAMAAAATGHQSILTPIHQREGPG